MPSQHDLFLSFATSDREREVAGRRLDLVTEVKTTLESFRHPRGGKAFRVCTFDQDFELHATTHEAMRAAISASRGMLVLCGAGAVGNANIEFELETARAYAQATEFPVIVARVDGPVARWFDDRLPVLPVSRDDGDDDDVPAIRLAVTFEVEPGMTLRAWRRRLVNECAKIVGKVLNVPPDQVRDRFELERRKRAARLGILTLVAVFAAGVAATMWRAGVIEGANRLAWNARSHLSSRCGTPRGIEFAIRALTSVPPWLGETPASAIVATHELLDQVRSELEIVCARRAVQSVMLLDRAAVVHCLEREVYWVSTDWPPERRLLTSQAHLVAVSEAGFVATSDDLFVSWHDRDGRLLRRHSLLGDKLTFLAFASAPVLVYGTTSGVSRWDAETEQPIRLQSIAGCLASPPPVLRGGFLVCARSERELVIIDVEDDRVVLRHPSAGRLRHFDLDPISLQVAVSEGDGEVHAGLVSIEPWAAPKCCWPTEDLVKVSEGGGRLLVEAPPRNQLQWIDVESREAWIGPGLSGPVNVAWLAPSGDRILAGTDRGGVCEWLPEEGSVTTLYCPQDPPLWVEGTHDQRVAVGWFQSHATIWWPHATRGVRGVSGHGSPSSGSGSPSGTASERSYRVLDRRLEATSQNGKVIWSQEHSEQTKTSRLVVEPSGELLLRFGNDGTREVLDAATGKSLWRRNVGTEAFDAAVFDGKAGLFLALNEGSVEAVNARSGETSYRLKLAPFELVQLFLSPDGARLAAIGYAGDEHSLFLVDTQRHEQVAVARIGKIDVCDLVFEENDVVSVRADDGTTLRFDLSQEAALSEACAVARMYDEIWRNVDATCVERATSVERSLASSSSQLSAR